jgi:hypothetical protein
MGGDGNSGSQISPHSAEDINNIIQMLLDSPYGGTWSGSSGGEPYTFTEQDIDAIDAFLNGMTDATDPVTGENFCLFQSDAALSMTAQSGQDCFPYTLGYIAQCMGASPSQSISQFATALSNMGMDLENVGTEMSGQQMLNFIDNYFSTVSLPDGHGVVGALDLGNCIFASMDSGETDNNGNPIYHAITIVGYSMTDDGEPNLSDLKLKYMDPATGALGTMSLWDFNNHAHLARVVTGLNPNWTPPH